MFEGLAVGTIDAIATDHSPHHCDEKCVEFSRAPFGIVGLETAVSICLDRLVRPGIIDMKRMVALFTTGPTGVLRLDKRGKGKLAVGADADIAIWDAEREVTITNDLLHHNVDYTPYEGMTVRGWPETVLSRGEIIVRDRDVVCDEGRGRFYRCERPVPARPKEMP